MNLRFHAHMTDGEKPEALWEPPPEDYTPQDEWAPDAREARNLKENKIISWLEGAHHYLLPFRDFLMCTTRPKRFLQVRLS